jgi:hypothetical protein
MADSVLEVVVAGSESPSNGSRTILDAVGVVGNVASIWLEESSLLRSLGATDGDGERGVGGVNAGTDGGVVTGSLWCVLGLRICKESTPLDSKCTNFRTTVAPLVSVSSRFFKFGNVWRRSNA